MKTARFGAFGTAACCALLPLLSPAQEPATNNSEEADTTLAEVVVTARRRAESAQDVPISIVTRSGDYLERSRVDSVTELDRVVPGFVFNNAEGGGQSTMGIRGVSTFSQELVGPQSVGLLVDDVVADTIGQAVTEFNDVKRIEVLRGPQGTLFGRNTTGGVVHIVTEDPVHEFEGKLSAGYGSYNEVKLNGTVNLPLNENLAARASMFSINRDGYIENIHDGRMLGSDEEAGVRAKFLYTPREGTSLNFAFTYVGREQEGRASPVVRFGPSSSDSDREINAGIAGPENHKVNGIGSHPFKDRVAAASVTWTQAIGDFELTSISAFQHWKWDFGADQLFRTFNAPVEPLGVEKFFLEFELSGWSQELRLASPSGQRLEYVVGAFASGSHTTEFRDFRFNFATDPDPAAAIYVAEPHTVQDSKPLNYAAFGELDFHLTDTVTLTAGSRWTRDEMDVTVDAVPVPGFDADSGIGFDSQGRLWIPILAAVVPGTQKASVSASEMTWRAGLRWQPTADLMIYGTAARGFKGPTVTALGPVAKVDPEIATNYEFGVKSSFLDRRLTANLSVFHTDIRDFQAEGSADIVSPTGERIPTIRLTNAAKVRSQGAEFELSFAPTEQLAFDLALAYVDAEYVHFTAASCFADQTVPQGCVDRDPASEDDLRFQDLSGRRLPFSPDWAGSAAVTYDFARPLRSLMPRLRLDYNYKSRINWSTGLEPLTEADAVGIWGLSLGLSTQDERYEVVGFVKNLTDEFVVNGLEGGNGTILADLPPEYQRTWGIELNYRFE